MNNIQLHDIIKTMLQKGSDADSILCTVNALKPLYEAKKDIAIMPKGTHMKVHGCSFELAQDTEVFATQDEIDNILKMQQQWGNQPRTGLAGAEQVGKHDSSVLSEKPCVLDNSSKSRDKNFEEIENAIVYLFRHSPRVEISLRNALIRARPPRVIF